MNKTTIELDEEKLERVMRLGGFATRKEAVDWALTEAERLVSIKQIAENPWSAEVLREAVDPDYDIMAIRRQSVTSSAKSRKKKS